MMLARTTLTTIITLRIITVIFNSTVYAYAVAVLLSITLLNTFMLTVRAVPTTTFLIKRSLGFAKCTFTIILTRKKAGASLLLKSGEPLIAT